MINKNLCYQIKILNKSNILLTDILSHIDELIKQNYLKSIKWHIIYLKMNTSKYDLFEYLHEYHEYANRIHDFAHKCFEFKQFELGKKNMLLGKNIHKLTENLMNYSSLNY